MSEFICSDVVKLFKKLIFVLISRQVKPVKACVAFRVRIGIVEFRPFNHKLDHLVSVTLKILEPQNWDAGCACDIMQ